MSLTAYILCSTLTIMSMPNAKLACEQAPVILEVSSKYDIRPELLVSLIYYESGWRPTVRSSSGACGLTQVLPKYTRPYVSCSKLKDPETSIRVGARILHELKHKSKGNIKQALCSYNAGWRNCQSYRGKVKGTGYTRKILKLAKKIKKELREVWQCLEVEEECCMNEKPWKL